MADNNNTGLLKTALMLYAILVLFYGFGYMLVPDAFVKVSGGAPVYDGWLRWSGAVLVVLGIGALLTFRNPQGQGIFVTILSMGCFLVALCLFWAVLNPETAGKRWFPATPAVIDLILAILLWAGRAKAKNILYP